jgi:hypothetical protein
MAARGLSASYASPSSGFCVRPASALRDGACVLFVCQNTAPAQCTIAVTSQHPWKANLRSFEQPRELGNIGADPPTPHKRAVQDWMLPKLKRTETGETL